MNIFVNYARKNGWDCFEFNSEKNIDVQLKNMEYSRFPYMDTFKYFNRETCLLSRNEYDRSTHVKLTSQEGSYERA